MSIDHFMYVGAYVLLNKEIGCREPIVDGVREYWGCEEHGSVRRVGNMQAQFCEQCGTAHKHCKVPNVLDDVLHNVISEEMTDHPLYIAIHNIGYHSWFEGEGEEAIIVDRPECSIDVPSIDCNDMNTIITCPTLSPADAIKCIETEHAEALGVLKEYFKEVTVVYGGVYTCS